MNHSGEGTFAGFVCGHPSGGCMATAGGAEGSEWVEAKATAVPVAVPGRPETG